MLSEWEQRRLLWRWEGTHLDDNDTKSGCYVDNVMLQVEKFQHIKIHALFNNINFYKYHVRIIM